MLSVAGSAIRIGRVLSRGPGLDLARLGLSRNRSAATKKPDSTRTVPTCHDSFQTTRGPSADVAGSVKNDLPARYQGYQRLAECVSQGCLSRASENSSGQTPPKPEA